MMEHVLLAGVKLHNGFIDPCHVGYLREWRENAIQRADDGDVSASICLQAAMIDWVLDGRPNHDWLGVMDEFLLLGDSPIAYSEQFSRRLHGFTAQYLQSSIHAIHTRWWIEVASGGTVDHARYASLLLKKRQSDGLFYDRDISETILRHRMKTELTMSMAMVIEILKASDLINEQFAIELATELCNPSKCPPLGYMSMEYLRLMALEILGLKALFPRGIEGHIITCSEGLNIGWCDFSMGSKVDAYMGTAKRTRRDHPIHSPLIACYVGKLIESVTDSNLASSFRMRMDDYNRHLQSNPLDIPAFQMRDVPIPFGSDRTPIEVICASELIAKCPQK
jgi:hypothetical protein